MKQIFLILLLVKSVLAFDDDSYINVDMMFALPEAEYIPLDSMYTIDIGVSWKLSQEYESWLLGVQGGSGRADLDSHIYGTYELVGKLYYELDDKFMLGFLYGISQFQDNSTELYASLYAVQLLYHHKSDRWDDRLFRALFFDMDTGIGLEFRSLDFNNENFNSDFASLFVSLIY